MKYFVTGATGFIGGRVARRLVAAGHEVSAIARVPGRTRDLSDLGVAVHQGDITDKESLRRPMEGADGVFHIAAWYQVGVRDKSQAYPTNVDGTLNVLETMRDLGIPKGVYTSTLAVFSDTHGQLVDESYHYDGPFLSEYDRTKWVAHYRVAKPLMEAGLPLVIVQPGVVYGPGDTSAMRDTFVRYLRRRLPMAPSRTAFCWAHVDDIVQGHLLALDRGRAGECYIIAGPPHTLTDAFAIAERITDIPAPRIHLGPGLMRATATLAAWVERLVPLPEAYSAETLRVSAGVTYLGSNAKARAELGYDPRPLEDGLRETLPDELRRLGLPEKVPSV